MIRPVPAALLALAGSALLHGLGIMSASFPGPDLRAGGEANAPPLLGDSFADLAEGMAQPVLPRPLQLPVATDLHDASPVIPAAARPVPNVVNTAVRPAPGSALAPVQPRQPTMSAVAPVSAKAPARRPEPAPQRVTMPEGGTQATRKGSVSGDVTGRSAKAQAPRPTRGDAGKAASASYGSSVMRKVASTRKRTTALRGTVLIAFAIDASGQLASVSVVRSSGQPELDALGIDHIRRAAPFLPPPSGADTRFSVEFQGRR